MTMHQIIQQKRKELGLTQEQIAEYLGVSTPAVNKWEKGVTCPDIALLPRLARLLHIDLNTLFCFHESLTMQEIIQIVKEIADMAEQKDIHTAFALAREKIQEYPNSDELLHYLTLQMKGTLILSGTAPQEREVYEAQIRSWYERLCESGNDKIRNSANFMLANEYMQQNDYERAAQKLELIPERDDIPNKQMQQIELYLHQNQTDEAAKLAESLLLKAVNEVQMTLYKLTSIELQDGNMEIAGLLADKARQMTEVFDLWDYSAEVAAFEIAAQRKDADQAMEILTRMLESFSAPWDMKKSPLYHRIAKETMSAQQEKLIRPLIRPLLADLETDPEFEFLRQHKAFAGLISLYH